MNPKIFTLNGKIKARYIVTAIFVLNMALWVGASAATGCNGNC